MLKEIQRKNELRKILVAGNFEIIEVDPATGKWRQTTEKNKTIGKIFIRQNEAAHIDPELIIKKYEKILNGYFKI